MARPHQTSKEVLRLQRCCCCSEHKQGQKGSFYVM
ncbi:hypothetical protein M758_7G113700 [Ceratodon purpureus]|uniref:Uncharacterized protein n=1 Tax=Ceratodon purpureus TaxID=3225 RepID=A0A8T0HBP7_CERPU|nr:hypothetical protein KC19_7G162700 [Ceratodon purpureus]KAG0611081.1 hypothetical protein M758_7G113700 [Ceratodon purpureus]